MRQPDLQQDVGSDARRHPGLPVTAVRRDDSRRPNGPPEEGTIEVHLFFIPFQIYTTSSVQYHRFWINESFGFLICINGSFTFWINDLRFWIN